MLYKYRKALDTKLDEVLKRYPSGAQVEDQELIDAIGRAIGTFGIRSDSSTWAKDIRIRLKNEKGMQSKDGFFTIA